MHWSCVLDLSAVVGACQRRYAWFDVQLRKAQERSEKCQKETEAARQRYTRALLDLDASNGKYMEDMVDVFDRTQTFEQRRLDFMKFILLELHNSLDYSQNPTLVFTCECFLNSRTDAEVVDLLVIYVVNH